MIEKLQHKYALSRQGAIDMIKACVAVCVSDMVLMLPAGILYLLIGNLLDYKTGDERILIYIFGSAAVLALIAFTQHIQYNATFLSTYKESGVRRTAIAEKLRKLPLSYFGKKDLSDLTTTIMSDCARMETASSHWIPELIGSVLSAFIVGAAMFVMFDWRLALAAFWVIPVSFLVLVTSSGVQKKAIKKNVEVSLSLNDGIQECLECVRDLRANNAQDRYMDGVEDKIRAVEKQALFTELKTSLFVSSAQMVLKLGIATTALAGGAMFVSGKITILTFFLFLMIASRLYDPMQIALQNFAAVIATGVQCERLDEVLSHEVQTGAEKLTNQGYDIVFDHVKFSYSDDTNVLDDVSFTAKQGSVTALIGPSGGGKTTVSRLAARFWDINDGKITVGGMDVGKTDPEQLMSLYSIVFQDVMLFDNSVMENIRIGRKDATDEEVMEAARMANCDDFIRRLPEGYQTCIGENGSELSGGERQRISIARAFLKNAPIILLDEATASLDVENETKIQQALSRLIEDKTVLIIAHRMRTIANADYIVVLKDGKTAEQGTPEELLKKGGIYRHMAELQLQSNTMWEIAVSSRAID